MSPLAALAKAPAVWRALAAFVAGACGALALAPVHFWPAFFIPMTMAALLLDARRVARPWRRAAFDGFFLGFGYFVAGLWWLGEAFFADDGRFLWALPLGVLGLPAVLACFTALGFVAARALWRPGPQRLCALAVGLSLGEFLRGTLFTGFPWNDFGMALGADVLLAQSASIWGLYGLTMLSALIFSAPALLLDRKERLFGVAALALLPALALFGQGRLNAPQAFVEGLHLRLVQPNIALDDFAYDRRDALLDAYLRLSTAEGIAPTHIFWPESAFPFLLDRSPEVLARLAAELPGKILLTGAARAESAGPEVHYFNAIEVVANGQPIHSVDKIHLVPFGEYLPFGEILTRLGLTQFVDMPGGFEPGRQAQVLHAPGLPSILPMICYESIFPQEIAARLTGAAERPGLLLNVTNDGWFGVTSGPWQHLDQARLRAVEQGLPLIRVANTGVSAIIDGYGRVVAQSGLGVEAVIDGPLPQALPQTFFVAWPHGAPLSLWFFLLFVAFCGQTRFDFRAAVRAN